LPVENPLNLFSSKSDNRNKPSTTAIFRTLLGASGFWLVCTLSLGTTLLRETFNLWMPTYFTQAVGMTNAQAASGSALFPFFGGISVLLAGFLSDVLGPAGRSRILFAGLSLSVLALAALAHVPVHASRILPLALVATVAFLLIGPYSYLAGAISLDFGGKEGSATASGLIDGVGYLAGVLSGNSMAHIAVTYGWQTMFLVLAGVAALSSVVAGLAVWEQRRRVVSITVRLKEAA